MRANSDTYVLISGRWDPTIAVVSLKAALDAANWGTDRAVVSRPRVTPDILTANGASISAIGLPVSLAVSPDRSRVFVVNHAGRASPEATARMPHGHHGAVAVLELAAALDPANDGTLGAVRDFVETGTGGPVGCALTPDGHQLLVTSAEGEGAEDGGCRISVLDAEPSVHIRNYTLAHSGAPSSRPSPDGGFGRFPNPNGIAISGIGGGLVFTANGGTDDVSVLRLPALLAGKPDALVTKIPLPSGPFGICVSPDGSLLAVANRESARTGEEGSTVSLIDVGRALTGGEQVIAHIPVGSDDGQPSRPMTVAFAADGRSLFASCYRTGTISRLGPDERGGWGERQRVKLGAPGNANPCPRGVTVTADGRFVLVAGGARGESRSSQLWALDAASLAEVGRVSGVGNEAYLLEAVTL